MERNPVLTLLKSNAVYDFSGVIGHKKEINSLMQKRLEQISDEQTKVLTKTRNYRIGSLDYAIKKASVDKSTYNKYENGKRKLNNNGVK